jgi:hypothetical protein
MQRPRPVGGSDGFGGAAPSTPRVELDVPVALSTIHTAGLQVVPGPVGGTVLDVGHPTLTPLLPYLPATGTWVWARDAPGVSEARRRMRPANTIVLDGRNRANVSWRKSCADLVVVPVDEIDPAGAESVWPATLLDLTAVPQWRISYRLLARPADVAGFHLDLTDVPPSEIALGPVHTLGQALRCWQLAGRTDRPLLVLRGAGTVLARHAVATLLSACRAGELPAPVVRVDVSATVLDVAVRQVDASIHGGPARAGNELAAQGRTQTGQHLVVRGFPAAPAPDRPAAVLLGARAVTGSMTPRGRERSFTPRP